MAILNIGDYTDGSDTNSRFLVDIGETVLTVTGILSADDNHHKTKDYGVNFFDGDFLFQYDYKYAVGTGFCNFSTLANLLDDEVGVKDAGGDQISVKTWSTGSLVVNYIYDGLAYLGNTLSTSIGTQYYHDFRRDEAVGTYGTIYCDVYSDSDRTTLVGTSSIALFSLVDYRYHMLAQSWNASTGSTSHVIGNFDDSPFVTNGRTTTIGGKRPFIDKELITIGKNPIIT